MNILFYSPLAPPRTTYKIQNISSAPEGSLSSPLPRGNNSSDYCRHRLLLLVFEFHINGIIKYVCIIVWLWLLLLNVMSVRFTPVFHLTLAWFFLSLYGISWIIHEFTCHSMVDGFLDCVQFGDIVNKLL